jgi:DNA-binding response OmpR family regulator
MSARCILTIEDDAAIRRGIVDALTIAGYRVLQAARADEGRATALRETYDLLLLDLVLPGGSGLDLLRTLRDARPTQPVIILTARGDENDRVAGLRLGADDYVVKPFSVRELLARVEAVLRRAPQELHASPTIELAGGRRIDLARREIRDEGGERTEISEREADLLRYLSAHSDRAVSREELLQRVWGIDARGMTTRTIDMHVARLREKLGDDPADPVILLTVRGKGYMFQTATCNRGQ